MPHVPWHVCASSDTWAHTPCCMCHGAYVTALMPWGMHHAACAWHMFLSCRTLMHTPCFMCYGVCVPAVTPCYACTMLSEPWSFTSCHTLEHVPCCMCHSTYRPAATPDRHTCTPMVLVCAQKLYCSYELHCIKLAGNFICNDKSCKDVNFTTEASPNTAEATSKNRLVAVYI